MKRVTLIAIMLVTLLCGLAYADNLARQGKVWKYTIGSTTYTITPFAATDTMVGKNTTDTLTNKTLTSPTISTPTFTGNLTLDDGSGASPSLIYKDETDETLTILKSNTTPGNVTATFSNASSAYQVTTGNLRVGNGTNDTTLNGEDAYIEGTLEVDGALNFDGSADFASTIAGAGNLTLDDGSGASPSIVLIDETDETYTVLKSNTTPGNVTATFSNASAALQVTTGNLRVGNGANDTTLNGEDAYIEGTLEVDGSLNLDGAADFASTIAGAGNITLDDGSGPSPSIILIDETDETLTILKSNTTPGDVTATFSNASSSAQITGGNLRVGNGVNDTTLDGEDAYVEGNLEVDGSLNFDGAADFASTIAGAGNLTLDDGSGASPSIVLIDETDETFTLLKSNTTPGDVTATFSNASSSAQVTTGNLRVGNGANDVTLNGEDAYIEGTLEVDGTARLDGVVTFNADPLLSGTTPTLTVGDGGDEDNAVIFDGDLVDYHIGFDATGDNIAIGVGSALGTTDAITIAESQQVTVVNSIMYPAETTTTANVLTSTECGKIVWLNSGTEFATTLPAVSTVSAGCTFDFYISDGGAPTGADYTIITGNSLENVIVGGVVEREVDTGDDGPWCPTGTKCDTITLVQDLAFEGDWVRFASDGSIYYMTGIVNSDGGLTAVQAD